MLGSLDVWMVFVGRLTSEFFTGRGCFIVVFCVYTLMFKMPLALLVKGLVNLLFFVNPFGLTMGLSLGLFGSASITSEEIFWSCFACPVQPLVESQRRQEICNQILQTCM